MKRMCLWTSWEIANKNLAFLNCLALDLQRVLLSDINIDCNIYCCQYYPTLGSRSETICDKLRNAPICRLLIQI